MVCYMIACMCEVEVRRNLMAATNNYFNCQLIYFPVSNVMSSAYLFCQTNCPKPKYFQFTVIYNREKQ